MPYIPTGTTRSDLSSIKKRSRDRRYNKKGTPKFTAFLFLNGENRLFQSKKTENDYFPTICTVMVQNLCFLPKIEGIRFTKIHKEERAEALTICARMC